MTVRVGINGFGRIGRSFTRALLARGADAGVELVAVNDPFGDSHTMAFLLKHDSVGGILPNDVAETPDGIAIDGKGIKKLESREPSEIPWGDLAFPTIRTTLELFFADRAQMRESGGTYQFHTRDIAGPMRPPVQPD